MTALITHQPHSSQQQHHDHRHYQHCRQQQHIAVVPVPANPHCPRLTYIRIASAQQPQTSTTVLSRNYSERKFSLFNMPLYAAIQLLRFEFTCNETKNAFVVPGNFTLPSMRCFDKEYLTTEEVVHETALATTFGMLEVLRDLHLVFVYIDDVPVAGELKTEHLKLVFARLHENGLNIKPNKCTFRVKNIDFLGHNVSQNKTMYTL
uniref:Reverse transcriptase domain-containing protein n=1 Tax=Glossina austeni TaxID=7395 RepID=A0A1A9V778_GLOAU